ncbi:Stf0 family sulfotransferase [Candidatus Methylopumilus turicensis]|nr:Stf0 family sulfotransferase [Candidatus Methylopumilus turicensis]
MRNKQIQLKRLKYHEDQMSPSIDFASVSQPKQRYCIASSPRSGSTLISKMLLTTHLAGDPKEYLNPLLMHAWHRISHQPILLNEYIKQIESRRTTENGAFGIKIHWRHLENLSKTIDSRKINSLINNFDKFIFVRRRDKLAQAISYYKAVTTGVFHSDQEGWLNEYDIPDPPFNGPQILKHLTDITREDASWENYFKYSNKPVYEIYHEDLIECYQMKAKEILNFLEIYPEEIPAIPTKKMNKKLSKNYKEQLLKTIGLNIAL